MSQIAPADIGSVEPFVNRDFVKYNPLSKKWLATTANKTCKLCGWSQDPKAILCESCGSPSLRLVAKNEQVHPTSEGATAHLRRPVKYCWHERVDPDAGTSIKHPLRERTRKVVNVSNAEIYDEHFCETCGSCFSWTGGRTATPEEIKDCKNGKIARKTTEPTLIMGANL